MEEKSKTLRTLNELLQGEYMSVDAFNTYISKSDEEDVKKALQDVQNRNRENIKTLANYIQNEGGKPDENVGLKGKFAEMKINMELRSKAGSTNIVRRSIEGMTRGISMAEKVLRGKLDDESRSLVGGILEKDRESIDELRTLQ